MPEKGEKAMAYTNDLTELFRVVWKRKWLILIPTFFCVLVTGAVSFYLPRKWKVDCIIVPGKVLTQTSSGTFQEFNVTDPREIAEIVNQKTYAAPVAAQLQMKLTQFPRLTARHLKNTDLVEISLKESDREKGKRILSETYSLIRQDIDANIGAEINKLEVQKKNLEVQIEEQELKIKDKSHDIAQKKNAIKQNRIGIKIKLSRKTEQEQQIESLANLTKISEERVNKIAGEMEETRSRVGEIEALQKEVMAEGKENALTLLVYSNEIQENLRYLDNLDKELKREKTAQEEYRLKILTTREALKVLDLDIEMINAGIESLNTQILSIENAVEMHRKNIARIRNNISLLDEGRTRIQPTRLGKEPASSIYPVSPNKTLNVIIAAVLSLVLFTLAALFMEYVAADPSRKSE